MNTFNSLKLTDIYNLPSNYYSTSADLFYVASDIRKRNSIFVANSYQTTLSTLADTFKCCSWSNCFNNIKTAYTNINSLSQDWQLITPLTSTFAGNSAKWDNFYSIINANSAKWNDPDYLTIFPVGYIYMSLAATSPESLFLSPAGTQLNWNWERFGQGRVIVGQSTNSTCFSTSNSCGGLYCVPLQTTHLPSHSHRYNIYTQDTYVGCYEFGGLPNTFASGLKPSNCSQQIKVVIGSSGATTVEPHLNIQPSFGVYMWRRTA